MKPGLQTYLHDHTYPPLLLRRPRLIRFIHAWNLLVLQRNQVTRRKVLRLLPGLPPGSLVVDAGCGDGQHIFPYWRKFPKLRFWGIDKNSGHIAFCKKYGGAGPNDTQPLFFHQNLKALAWENEADLLLAIGILQYIEDDRAVLKNFYKTLKANGKLVVYTPVNGRSVLPLYRYFFEKKEHYEKSQDRKRVYAPGEIFEKLAAAGFEVTAFRYTYGTLGIAGHELYSLLLMGLGSAGVRAWLFVPALAALLPLILLLNRVDAVLPKKNGNGLLLTAVKKPPKD